MPEGTPPTPAPRERALTSGWIGAQALTNAVRPGAAHRIAVTLGGDAARAAIEVADDGRGVRGTRVRLTVPTDPGEGSFTP